MTLVAARTYAVLIRFGIDLGMLARSCSICLNNFPRFISGLRAGWRTCRVVRGGGGRLLRTDRRGGHLGPHQGFHLTRPASCAASRRNTFLTRMSEFSVPLRKFLKTGFCSAISKVPASIAARQ